MQTGAEECGSVRPLGITAKLRTRAITRQDGDLIVKLSKRVIGKVGSGGRIRTYDQRINSPLRYRCATPE